LVAEIIDSRNAICNVRAAAGAGYKKVLLAAFRANLPDFGTSGAKNFAVIDD